MSPHKLTKSPDRQSLSSELRLIDMALSCIEGSCCMESKLKLADVLTGQFFAYFDILTVSRWNITAAWPQPVIAHVSFVAMVIRYNGSMSASPRCVLAIIENLHECRSMFQLGVRPFVARLSLKCHS